MFAYVFILASLLLIFWCFIYIIVPCISPHAGQDSVQVGELPTLAHSVSGVFYVDDAVTFRIENFTYDGQGPGMSHQSENYWHTILQFISNIPCFGAHRIIVLCFPCFCLDAYTIKFVHCIDAFIFYYPPGIGFGILYTLQFISNILCFFMLSFFVS